MCLCVLPTIKIGIQHVQRHRNHGHKFNKDNTGNEWAAYIESIRIRTDNLSEKDTNVSD